MRSIAVLVLLLIAFASPASIPIAVAAEPSKTTIAVVGDSLADGLWGGLYRVVQKEKRIGLFRGAKNSIGFTGGDLTDLIDRANGPGPVHAIVMMIGANDRRSMFVDGKPRALLNTPGWVEIYKTRVGRFMDHAGRLKVPLVWLLLPVMREAAATSDAAVINGIVTEAAASRSFVTLIDTAKLTADEAGAYTAHFADLTGQKRQMRASDGVHFEQAAYELFGHMVLKRLQEVSPVFAKIANE